MRIAEVFGHGVENSSDSANADRVNRRCPFRSGPCTKASRTDPIGICSLSDGATATATCPVRFIQNDSIFRDAARIAFGDGASFGVFPEVHILTIEARDGRRPRKIGKVDYLLGRIEEGVITDFAALEVQGVYFSGDEIRPALKHYLEHGSLDEAISDRRPDFRSSAQKRLMPQLFLKVPVFRRWGKKFFVAIDAHFFAELPRFSETNSQKNSELTWLIYSLAKQGPDYTLTGPTVAFSEWESVYHALREGVPPEEQEIIRELQAKLSITGPLAPKVLTT